MRLRSYHGVAAFTALLTGCYTLQPVERTVPVPGDEVAFDITDLGRVGLGAAAGPEIGVVQGRLVEHKNEEFVVAVSELRTIRGATQVWTGEQVSIRPEWISTMYQRQYSKAKTYALAASVVAAGVFIATRSLIARGTEDSVAVPPGGTSLRIP
ncbi:MAG TPA: hypothetical protein VF929_04320 [Gemmatimonadaceae bacterium]